MDKSQNGASHSSAQGAPPALPSGLVDLMAVTPEGAVTDWRGGDGYGAGAAARYGAEENKGFDFAQFLAVVKRRWPLMLTTFALALGLGVLFNALARPVYQSSAMLEVDTGAPSDISADIPGLGDFMESKQSRSIDTQIEILRGGPILSEAHKQLTPALQAKLDGFGPVTVEQVNDSNLLTVEARAYNAAAAAALANAVCTRYIGLSLQKNRNNSQGALQYLKDRIATVQKQRFERQKALKDFKERTGIFSISDQATALATALTQSQAGLQQVQAERAATQAQLKRTQLSLASIPASKVVPVGIARNPQVLALQSQLTQLEIERSTASREYTDTSFQVKALNEQIRSLQGQLRASAQTTVSAWKPDPVREPLAQAVASLQSQVWANDARLAALSQQVGQARGSLARLPEQEFQFTQLSTDVTILQNTYTTLVARLQSLQIGAQAKVADARVVYPAKASTAPVSPVKKRTLLYAALLGTLAAIALAMLVDALDNRIYNDADAQRATSLPVLAHIPFLKNPEEQSLSRSGDRVTPLLESFRMLRANIAFSAADKPIRAIVVTSSVPNEGKSNSALNLAIATALGGERTVLIDLDLRRPTQHKLSGLSNSVGFTNVISGQATLEEALQDTSTPGLRVLTSGPVPPNPFRLLNSQSARQTILKVIEDADFVVVDTPPMLGLADARLISSLVDGTLMIISCQETGRREAGRAADLLMQTGNEVLGTVLTKVPSSSDFYAYQQYGRYFNEDAENDAPALEEGGKKKR